MAEWRDADLWIVSILFYIVFLLTDGLPFLVASWLVEGVAFIVMVIGLYEKVADWLRNRKRRKTPIVRRG